MESPFLFSLYLVSLTAATSVSLTLALWLSAQPETRGRREFLFLLAASAVWAGSALTALVSPNPTLDVALTYLQTVATIVVTFSWFWFATVYTDRDVSLRSPVFGGVATAGVLLLVALLTAPVHETLAPSLQDVYWDLQVQSVPFQHVARRQGPIYKCGVLWAYLINSIATYYLLRSFYESPSRSNRSVVLIIAASATGSLPNFLTFLDVMPLANYDHTAFGIVPFFMLIAYMVFYDDMLEQVPAAHRKALETLPDVVVVFDEKRRIVDMNAAGMEVFDIDDDPTGSGAQTVLSHHSELVDRLFDHQQIDTKETFVVNGQLRHFSVTSRPVEFNRQHDGLLLILKDITELKEREQDLELLKRIQSRVLRHNIRNDLQVIRGLGQLIATENDGRTEDQADRIVEQVEQLSETTEKAQQMEDVIDASDSRIDQDVCQVVEYVAERARDRFQGATVAVERPEVAWAMAHGDLEAAIWNLTENAITHCDRPVPDVTITVKTTGASVTVIVADNGPGIPKHEIEVLKQQSESALQHGSGAGLWLVNWIAKMSAGSLAFDTAGTGTAVHLQLPAADRALRETDQPQTPQPPRSLTQKRQ
jgi:PAS domain S-box-containing protein